MSLSRLYAVYCEGRWLADLSGARGHNGEHAIGCPVYSPNMNTSKEARAQARKLGWKRIACDVPGLPRRVDMSPQCHARHVEQQKGDAS